MKRSAVVILALGLAAALGGCNPAGYPPCFSGGCVYPPVYHDSYAGYSPAYAVGRPVAAFAEPPFDDPLVDYTQRTLTVSTTAGNSQAANLALQTSTPWPRHSYNTNIPANGAVSVKAVQNYESGTTPPLHSLGGSGGGNSGAGGSGGGGGQGGGSGG